MFDPVIVAVIASGSASMAGLRSKVDQEKNREAACMGSS
jgi:hypothetical protein